LFPELDRLSTRTIHPVGTGSSWNTTPRPTPRSRGLCGTRVGGGMMGCFTARCRMMRLRRLWCLMVMGITYNLQGLHFLQHILCQFGLIWIVIKVALIL